MKKILLAFVAILIGILGFGYYQYFYIPSLPQAEGAKTLSYTWQYKSKNFKLSETLYQSIDNYYVKRTKGIFQGLETGSIDKYMTLTDKSDETKKLVTKIKLIAKDNKLDEDQTLELAVGFIQSIPYDDIRAKTDLTHPRYPYEVLYEDKGICSDKTLLAVSILKSLGYGTAVFMWDKEQHMTAAVSCPMQYSNYNSGFCIVETTATGAKIGVVPDLQPDNLKAVGRTAINSYGGEKTIAVTKLSTPQIFAQKTGKTYLGVVARLAIEKEIADIGSYLKTQKEIISTQEYNLKSLKAQLDGYYRAKDFKPYNALVPKYNNLVNQIKVEIGQYNQKVERYNYLIKQ